MRRVNVITCRSPLSVAIIGTIAAVNATPLYAETQDEQGFAEIEEVVITASSRLPTGFESPKPKTIISRESLDNRGITNVADYLNEVPSFSATQSTSSSTLESRTAGTSNLDLRGLGPNRTLVLIDRKRYVATSTEGTVDTNIIPQTMLQGIEVVTGGASAQWGSDAVAGVVNLSLDRNLDGFKIDTRYGQSGEGDGEETFVSAAFGSEISDGRGHLVFAMERQDNKGVEDQTDRDWGKKLWGIVRNPADTGPNDGIADRIVTNDVRIGLGTPGGLLHPVMNHPAVGGIHFGANGELLNYDFGRIPVPATFRLLPFQIGGDGGSLGEHMSLQTPLDRRSFMLTLDYDISDDVQFFMDLSYAESRVINETVQPWNIIGGGPDIIAADNPFIPADLQQIMADNSVPALVLVRTNEDHGFLTSEIDTDTYRYLAGLKGDINSWDWELYWSTGRTNRLAVQHNNVITANRDFAIDAVIDPVTNDIVCRANLNGANGAPGCVPLNLFGDGRPSQESLDYIHGKSTIESTIKQDVFAFSFSGELLEMPAGQLAVAFGGEYRKESASDDPDTISASGGFLIGNTQPVSGDYDVTEFFVETGVPILQTDEGLSLSLNGAARTAEYSASGTANTWSVGLTFSPYSDLTLRTAVSQDIRAPNIGELFSSETLFFRNISDPLTGTVRLVPILEGGNPNLDPEKSKTKTIGVVYQPSWADSLSLSADWYDIEVVDAIDTLPRQTIVDGCFDANIGCENVTVSGGAIESVRATFINIAERTIEGVDLEAEYSFQEFMGGTLALRLLGNYVSENAFSPDGVQVFDDVGVVGIDAMGGNPVPEWRWNLSANYSGDRWGINGQVRYVDGGDLVNDTSPETIEHQVDDVYYLNLSGYFDLQFAEASHIRLYAGINNVLDEEPPVAPNNFVSNLATNPVFYDTMGRYFFAGIRASF